MRKLILATLVMVFSVAVSSGEEKTILAVDEGNPPFMFGKLDNPKGLYPVLSKEIFKKINLPLEIKAMPWNRVKDGGASGEFGIAGIYKTQEREKIFDYSDELFVERLMIFVKKDKIFKFSGIADLKGKNIGVIRGWSYGDEFDKAVKNKEIKTDESPADTNNFEKLEAGRIDCLIAIAESGAAILNSKKLNDKIITLERPVATNPTFIVFSKTKNKKDLINKINSAIKAMKNDGSYQKLISGFNFSMTE